MSIVDIILKECSGLINVYLGLNTRPGLNNKYLIFSVQRTFLNWFGSDWVKNLELVCKSRFRTNSDVAEKWCAVEKIWVAPLFFGLTQGFQKCKVFKTNGVQMAAKNVKNVGVLRHSATYGQIRLIFGQDVVYWSTTIWPSFSSLGLTIWSEWYWLWQEKKVIIIIIINLDKNNRCSVLRAWPTNNNLLYLMAPF